MARILSGADFGVRFPDRGGVPDNSFTNNLVAQLIGAGLEQQRQDQLLDAEAQKEAELIQVQGEKDRLFGLFTNLERIKNLPTDTAKRTELALLGQAEFNAGRDGSEFIEALNASTPDEFNLAISRLSTKAGNLAGEFDAVIKANQPVKPQTQTAKAKQDLEEGLITESEFIAETVKAAAPLTTIGKARADLKAGRITQEDFNSFKNAPKEFKTDVGKLIADKQLAIELFGQDSSQVQAIQSAIDSDAKGEAPKLSDIAGIRKEFTKQSGDFIQMRDAFNKIQSASNTGAGDVSLIFGFMKLIDPGSTVREGEFATAEQTAGIPTRITNLYNKALEGDRLGQEQRDSFKSEARNLFDAQLETQKQLEQVFTGLATRQGIDPQDVVLDFVGNVEGPEPVKVLNFDSQGNLIQ